MALLSHYNLQRVIDIYGSVQDRDLGGVAADINRIVDQNRKDLPRGSQLCGAGADRDHAELVPGPAGRAGCWRWCWCIC